MFSEVDVFLTNYPIVDPEIYQLWIEGYSGAEAVHYLKMKGIVEKMGVSLDLVSSDVQDHYRSFDVLERLLSSPSKLCEQPAFQLDTQTQAILIEKYYSLNDSVAREILGKKLSSRYRKDLDEVADKTGIKLKSCRRQFDNVKRIFKVVEEMPGNLTQNIKQQFALPEPLARKYAAIVFIITMRFETSKRKLQYLTFGDFYECSLSTMGYWTYTYQHSGPEYYDTEMDKEFLLDLRELRGLLDKEKEIKQ